MPLTTPLAETLMRASAPLMIPGEREAAGLTRFAAACPVLPNAPDVTVDAALRADREREGGGASPRRPAGHARWPGFVLAAVARWRGGRAGSPAPAVSPAAAVTPVP